MELVTQLNNCIGLKTPLVASKGRSGSVYKALLIIMTHCPVISREVISCYFPESTQSVRQQLIFLEKKGFVKKRPVKKGGKTVYDGRTKSLYVLTKKGYDEVIDLLINPPIYYQIKTDKYLMHYYASAHVFLSMLKRGVLLTGYHLEKQLGRFAKAGVQESDLYCDVACYTRTESLFFEQDMGNETISQLIDKFERYNKHSESLLEDGRKPYIVMLFKEPYKDLRNSPCFNVKTIYEIAEVLTVEPSLISYYERLLNNENRTELMSKHFITIGDLFSKFPYLKTNKIDLKEYAEGIENFMGKEYYKAFNNYQMRFTYKKRQALLKEYYRNYMTYFDDTETEPLYDSFKFFLENRQCYLWPSTDCSRFLEFFYEHDYKIEPLVQKYFSDACLYKDGYWTVNKTNMEKIATPVDRADRGLFISMCNTYISGPYHICVEFPTINIGSFVRVLHLRQRLANFTCGINVYLGVFNKDEAIFIADLLRLKETPHFASKTYVAAYTNFYFFNISDFSRLYTIVDNKMFYLDKIEVR